MKPVQFLKNKFRKSRKESWNKAYDAPINRKAEKAYENLVAQNPDYECSDAQLKKITEYSKEVLGSPAFAPWLKVYTAYQGEFKEGWMPDNYFGRVVCPKINGEFRKLGDLKTLSKRILQTDSIPDLAYYVNRVWTSVEGDILGKNNLIQFLFSDREYVFLKKNYSLQGNGILKLNRANFENLDIQKLGDFVIQAPIQQSDWLDQIVTGSVATLRITTVKLIGGKAKNRVSQLRVGRISNEYIKTKDCLRIPIDRQTGTFYPRAFGSDFNIFDKHPDTGFSFDSQIMPEHEKAVRLCEKLHDQVGMFQIIGWDVAINQNNEIQIMEWNTDHPGLVFSEMASGPHFQGLHWENLWK
ncbi:MAG: sugar-transfer associated ATP-grasp domain-containing protein [Algoriphagus sp.]|uniref:sugar-transfer associated ATP-grasp domain-containing protein n=1 Tax=Algoriphagus sp. TaxID=1872435 RepID=UPI00260B437E|nr:sugar-transfer associated ATP-grasp domain-containing protein [Algoriphagus sp.]MDG1275945.1 sugar-transfer associated ATP-grasp domain-containing protein [Algoriphagus sp.]